MSRPAVDIDSLTPDERLDLIEDLWDSLASTPEKIPLTVAQRLELDRRLDHLESGDEVQGVRLAPPPGGPGPLMAILQPTSVALDPEARELTITWTCGEPTKHDNTVLRKICPCATCRTEREKVKSAKGLRIIQGPAAPSLEPKIASVEPVGRYALRFDWDDGHSTGIYTYEFLRQNQK